MYGNRLKQHLQNVRSNKPGSTKMDVKQHFATVLCNIREHRTEVSWALQSLEDTHSGEGAPLLDNELLRRQLPCTFGRVIVYLLVGVSSLTAFRAERL